MSDGDFTHQPVMADEIATVFSSVPAGTLIDATLGGGGHTELLLDRRSDCAVLGLDQDPAALAAAGVRLARFAGRFRAVHTRFDRIGEIAAQQVPTGLSGVLFDLGVSSPQLDHADRGFSYRHTAPLDMRMDTTQTWDAGDVINGYDVDELTRVLRDHGDERFAYRIATAIVRSRPIHTTTELADIVRDAIPAPARRRGGHPAKRTFQAIRIEVNRELDILPHSIDAAIAATATHGRVAVLSYHSGEDRIVKERFARAADGGCTCPGGLPCVCDAVRLVRLVRGVAKKPSAAEVARNPRAESARLRVVERRSAADRGRD